MTEQEKYYLSLMQDVAAIQIGNDEGSAQEQTFTRIAVDMLAEAGETENVDLAYDEKDIGRKGQHKINAYAISENYETVDLFISIFGFSEAISIVAKSEIDRAAIRIANFFKKVVEKDYANDVAESSPIFEFANTLANFQELKENLVRVNVAILTNGEYSGDFPKSDVIHGYNVFYRVIDINYLYKISEQARVPIELDFNDFDGEKFKVSCLRADANNTDYKAYIAIIPGNCLAKMYERYGARLLEHNVRSFLQVTGKVNKGIRDTIRNEPHMFLAFNNGIAATADHIELDETGRFIKKISNLQIVNGGQTTASIYNSARKDKIDISNIFVQAKFSIIENPDQYANIVSQISRCANTQNKVNDADFSANTKELIQLERLSRYVFSPITAQNNMQTSWFFERARGQYKTLRSREGRTKALQRAFDKKYPKNQMFTKVELAKYINAWQEVYDGKKLVIGPHIVVRGNEKNYVLFRLFNLPDIDKIKEPYFEDVIAKCILFKEAEKRYGTKLNDYNIGELRQVVVPYTISLMNIVTKNRVDLYKIWKNQQASQSISDFIYDLMKQVNQFILDNSPISHYIEWAKKEECWNLVKSHSWDYNINEINADLIDDKNPPNRNTDIDISEEESLQNRAVAKSIPPALWNEIGKWGKDSGYFDIKKQAAVSKIAYKSRQNKTLTNEECKKGVELLDIVVRRNIELLQESEKYMGKWVSMKKVKMTNDDKHSLILEQISKMVTFDVDRNILSSEEKDFLFDILNNKCEKDYDADLFIERCMKKLVKKGFRPTE